MSQKPCGANDQSAALFKLQLEMAYASKGGANLQDSSSAPARSISGIPSTFRVVTVLKDIWESVHLEVEDIAQSEEGERRGATIGWVDDKLYVAIWTSRGDKIRLISVRRARKNEENIYTEKIQNDGGNG